MRLLGIINVFLVAGHLAFGHYGWAMFSAATLAFCVYSIWRHEYAN